jgi:hypothetical protein
MSSIRKGMGLKMAGKTNPRELGSARRIQLDSTGRKGRSGGREKQTGYAAGVRTKLLFRSPRGQLRCALRTSNGKSLAPLYFTAAFSLMVLTYSVGFGRSAPFSDEWVYFPGLVNFSWTWLMEPLNEHWLPLPKLLYIGTVRVFGMDVRSSQALMVVILAAAALLTVWELIQRDGWAFSWVVPFVVFHPAQYETLLSGINLHFALCAALLITAGVLALRDRAFGPTWSLIIVALCLSGATGLLYAVPLALAGLIGTRDIRRFWAWRLLALISVAGVSAWYAVGFKHQPDTPAYSVSAAPKAALEALGALVPLPYRLESSAGMLVGVLVGVVLLLGVGLLCTSPSVSTCQRLGLLACVAAVVFEVLGIGYGRGMNGPEAGIDSRFGSLTAPLFVLVLLIASVDPRDKLRRWLGWFVAGLVALSWPLAAHRAWAEGAAQKTAWQEFERDVRAGATVEQITGRHADTAITDDDVRDAYEELTSLRTWRLGPFRDYQGELRHTADPGTPRALKIEPTARSVALEPPRFVRAVRVRFRLYSGPNQVDYLSLGWKSPGLPKTHKAAIYTKGDGRLQEQLFWIWDDVDLLSLSVTGPVEPGLQVDELAVFEGDASELP